MGIHYVNIGGHSLIVIVLIVKNMMVIVEVQKLVIMMCAINSLKALLIVLYVK